MNKARLLIVEDERIVALGLAKRLESMGYTVVASAATGEAAVEKALALHPDLILMDIAMGKGMDGIAATAQIRKSLDVPVVYVTAYSDSETLERAKLTEPSGYILKPFDDADLKTAIEIGLYRHKSDRRVRENERWLAATLSSIGDGVIALDGRGCVRFTNARAAMLTGWSETEAAGKPIEAIFQVVRDSDHSPVRNPVREAMKTGKPAAIAPDSLLVHRSGREIPVEDSAAPILDLDGSVIGAVLVFRDVTERRRLEEHLRQAQKMEAIGRLAGGIAHDYNNLMTVITGYSEILMESTPRESPDFRALESIHTASTRASSLTRQILAFSRKQVLIPTVLDVNAVLRETESLARRLVGEDIRLVCRFGLHLGAIKADQTQLVQVVLNLVANARDAMPEGGSLSITTANAELSEAVANECPHVKPGRYVMISVSDTGSGIEPEVLPHVFEPFFTTKGVGEGTGLGLASVYGTVMQSGGHIDLSSTPGEGTTVRVYLPVVEAGETERKASEAARSPRGCETILLVEDDEALRRMTASILAQYGYTVIEAADGLQALTLAETHAGEIDLILTDLVMPNLSGRGLVEQLRSERAEVPVLYMSGYSDELVEQHGLRASDVDYLQKPYRLQELTGKVRALLDREDVPVAGHSPSSSPI